MINLRKTAAAALAVATLGAGIAATSTPAAAWGYRPYWGYGAAGFAGGLALGAIAAGAAAPTYYGYGGCYMTRQPVTDYYGNFRGYRRVRVCD